jgi:hypothetical protein
MQLTGNAQVNGVTLAEVGNYPVEITAGADNQVTTATFTIFIGDPCSRAVL